VTSAEPSGPPSEGRAVLVYTAARAGLLLLCLVLGWFAGLGGLLLVVAALLVSGAMSWFLLQRQRLAMGAAAERVVGRARIRLNERTSAEDAYAEQIQGTNPADRKS
jgi:hypothetical protein